MKKILSFIVLGLSLSSSVFAGASFDTLKLAFETANHPVTMEEFVSATITLTCTASIDANPNDFTPFTFWTLTIPANGPLFPEKKILAWGYHPEDRAVFEALQKNPHKLKIRTIPQMFGLTVEYTAIHTGLTIGETLYVRKLNDYYFFTRMIQNMENERIVDETAYGYCWKK